MDTQSKRPGLDQREDEQDVRRSDFQSDLLEDGCEWKERKKNER